MRKGHPGYRWAFVSAVALLCAVLVVALFNDGYNTEPPGGRRHTRSTPAATSPPVASPGHRSQRGHQSRPVRKQPKRATHKRRPSGASGTTPAPGKAAPAPAPTRRPHRPSRRPSRPATPQPSSPAPTTGQQAPPQQPAPAPQPQPQPVPVPTVPVPDIPGQVCRTVEPLVHCPIIG